VEPEIEQQNYAQLVLQIDDKTLTRKLVPYFQQRLSAPIAGARIDLRQLESGKPVGIPVAVRISGENVPTLRKIAEKAKSIFRNTPGAERVRDDWGSDTFSLALKIDSDRANMAGLTNLDVAQSSATSLDGDTVGLFRDGDRELPIVARLQAEQRARLSDLEDLYVYPQSSGKKIPLRQVSSLSYSTRTEKIRRRNQFRTITVACFPRDGVLPSEVMDQARLAIDKLKREMPGGYTLEIAGEEEDQEQSFGEMVIVGALLIVAIYVALVIQFKNAVKPLIVIAALPFGAAAAFVSLLLTGAPLGFMAVLGIISLMGVIVSHVIVLFDFIEEMHERGEPIEQSLIDAGLMRLRPVVVTVVATVLGLVPLAIHGGPLWQPLCYAQIGGLSFATLVTLAIVPVLYTFFVQDLKIVHWESKTKQADSQQDKRPTEQATQTSEFFAQ
jgi:multidrug efflux pump subunit AcrB